MPSGLINPWRVDCVAGATGLDPVQVGYLTTESEN